MSSEPALLPPPKESKSKPDDTLFQGGRELWLAKRLTDPEIYLPLQASKECPAPPDEHAGFAVDERKIKNKITKMSQHFKLAHRFRHSSDFGRTDEMTWRDAVKERCTYYFILEPVWASVWSDGINRCTGSLTNLDNNVITDRNPDEPRSTDSAQRHSDGSSEDERSDADTRSGHNQGWADVIPVMEDDNAGDAAEEELDKSLDSGRYCTATRVTPAFESQWTIFSQADRDEGQKGGSGGSTVQPKSLISDLLKQLNALGRYEIDARKEMEIRRMDLIQKTELAEIESRKAIRLAEINATTKQEKAVLEREKEICVEVERRVLAKEKELERLLDIVRKQLGSYLTQSTA
ncbi:hypothetical protein EC957_003569 [Mortierella hygrophila]|uniref:Uncharacterized protein n=1 Tax=Mortierella hygrophila TaxID=979708 RepID=A0A9P6F2Q3_9FUNG|nr:hypothetical protein EC957_003569 [Mortierella hygrophila]